MGLARVGPCRAAGRGALAARRDAPGRRPPESERARTSNRADTARSPGPCSPAARESSACWKRRGSRTSGLSNWATPSARPHDGGAPAAPRRSRRRLARASRTRPAGRAGRTTGRAGRLTLACRRPAAPSGRRSCSALDGPATSTAGRPIRDLGRDRGPDRAEPP